MTVGSATEWVTAVLALLALGAGVWAGITASRALRLEQHRQRLADMKDDAAQASLVAAWVQGQDSRRFEAVLRNGSNLPIYGVRVVYRSRETPDLGEATLEREALGPGDLPLPYPDGWQSTVPGDRINWAGDLSPTVSFRDAAGIAWHRDERGALKMVRGHGSTDWFARHGQELSGDSLGTMCGRCASTKSTDDQLAGVYDIGRVEA